jgi:VanZ family protein
MRILKNLKYYKWALVWSVVIFILCGMEMPPMETEGFFFVGFDKLAHLGFFFVLTILLFYGKIRYQHNYSFSSLTILKIILITGTLGAGIELMQWLFFYYRSAEWWDFFCDMAGVFMGVFSYILLHKSHYNEKDV